MNFDELLLMVARRLNLNDYDPPNDPPWRRGQIQAPFDYHTTIALEKYDKALWQNKGPSSIEQHTHTN